MRPSIDRSQGKWCPKVPYDVVGRAVNIGKEMFNVRGSVIFLLDHPGRSAAARGQFQTVTARRGPELVFVMVATYPSPHT
jgi:hypothetical protein